MIELRQWLEQHGLGKYAELLAENEVDFEVFPELEEADLEKIGLFQLLQVDRCMFIA